MYSLDESRFSKVSIYNNGIKIDAKSVNTSTIQTICISNNDIKKILNRFITNIGNINNDSLSSNDSYNEFTSDKLSAESNKIEDAVY